MPFQLNDIFYDPPRPRRRLVHRGHRLGPSLHQRHKTVVAQEHTARKLLRLGACARRSGSTRPRRWKTDTARRDGGADHANARAEPRLRPRPPHRLDPRGCFAMSSSSPGAENPPGGARRRGRHVRRRRQLPDRRPLLALSGGPRSRSRRCRPWPRNGSSGSRAAGFSVGCSNGHFGHFLVETTTRLWAAEGLDDLAGIVFYPKRALTHERRMFREMVPFFELCGLATPRDPRSAKTRRDRGGSGAAARLRDGRDDGRPARIPGLGP